MGKSVNSIIAGIEAGAYNDIFKELYVDDHLIPSQQERYICALKRFGELYGNLEVDIYSASGRTEIGGNHTDHQYGNVLAASINLDSIAVVSRQEGRKVSLLSEGYPMIEMTLDSLKPEENETGSTKALIRGVAAGMEERGFKIGGFKAYVTSDVLSGSGLSSSASFEILTGKILDGLYNDGKMDDVTNAIIGQYSENRFFGKPCGLMDQMACSVGGLIRIDFKDLAQPVLNKVETDFGKFSHSLCIVDTKGSHADLTEDYAAIPEEMKKVAAYFGKEVLSQISEKEFYKELPQIRQKTGDRAVLRSIHWFEENRRPKRQAAALENGDFDEFLRLIRESGRSSFQYLQNVYSSKNPHEQGVAIGLALGERILDGRGAVRVHGGGFAGTIQAFVPDDLAGQYRDRIEEVFGEGSCYVLKIRGLGGARVI